MTALADSARAVRYYEQGARDFATRYDSVSFDSVHGAISTHLPPAGTTVLDIGAGSGRDARALAARGYRVTAVEPATAFRKLAEGHDPSIVWIDDRLPNLARLQSGSERYAFILCSAVLMLLPVNQLAQSFAAMAQLLADGGRLAVSLRDPVGDEPHALFHAHSNAVVIAAAHEARLVAIAQADLPDMLGRAPHSWRSFVFTQRSP